MKKIIILCCIIGSFSAHAQDSVLINYLVKRIAAQQVKEDDFFMPGIFPSYISNKQKFKTKKKDNNIFYNGLMAYTLSQIKPELSSYNRDLIDTINQSTISLYPKFKNKKGRDTYNFWTTDSSFKFPYTFWIPLLRGHVTLPDDMDDTVLGLFAQQADDSIAEKVHALMQLYTNNDTADRKSIDKKYRSYATYSTWFGKKVPVVFDVCVLSNVLSFVQEYNLSWTKGDSAALQLIIACVQNGDYIKYPGFISPYYGKTSIILYHLARLMSIKKIPELDDIKTKLIDEALLEFNNTDNLLEKIIAGSALLKWEFDLPSIQLPAIADMEKQIEKNNFSFFLGNIPSYFSIGLKKFCIRNGIGIFYHYCPAYNDALLLEYLVLKNKN